MPRPLPRGLRVAAGALAALAIALQVGARALDEPLRRSVEQRMNRSLKGYSVRIAKLHLQPVGYTMTVEGLAVRQQANPEPPVALFPALRIGVHWRDILAGRLVAELTLDRPQLFINLTQLRAEAESPVPIRERGWQRAVEALYPLKINLLTARDGSVTYIDRDPGRPLRLSRLALVARNIRNVRVPDKVYPSSFRLETAIFDTGRGVVEGNANFLAEPHPGIDARLTLEKVPLERFGPVVSRANLEIRNGLFSGTGRIEYAPSVKAVHFRELAVEGMDVDYVHSARTAAAEKERAEVAGKAVRDVAASEMPVRVDRLTLSHCTIGLVNRDAARPYRVHIADADFRLTNLSNEFSQGPAEAELRGRFMGSGRTVATARFRPETNGPDLDLRVRIEETRLTDMDDLFRAYGNFDVSGGSFSLFSELQVRGDSVSGYVKPFFKDMKVSDRRTDRERKLFHRLYVMLVGGVARLLESRHRGEVATRADLSGPLSSPHVNTWQVVVRLVRNAFFKAILPRFESEASGGRPRK